MMSGQIHWTALTVFVFFFVLVTVLGFVASKWQTGGECYVRRYPGAMSV